MEAPWISRTRTQRIIREYECGEPRLAISAKFATPVEEIRDIVRLSPRHDEIEQLRRKSLEIESLAENS